MFSLKIVVNKKLMVSKKFESEKGCALKQKIVWKKGFRKIILLFFVFFGWSNLFWSEVFFAGVFLGQQKHLVKNKILFIKNMLV